MEAVVGVGNNSVDEGLAGRLHGLRHLGNLLLADVGIEPAPKEQVRGVQVRSAVGDGVGTAAVIGYAGRQRQHGIGQKRYLPAQAKPDAADFVGLHQRLRVQPVKRSPQVSRQVRTVDGAVVRHRAGGEVRVGDFQARRGRAVK